MKKIDLGQTITILANLGVIGGLIFVGMQLQQDREIALVDRMQALESNFYYWAELVNSSGDLWGRGLAGDELSPNEMLQFSSMAHARQFALYSHWFTSGLAVSSRDVTQDSFVQESALEIASNPGLLAWWRTLYRRNVEIGRAGSYDDLLNAAIDDYLAKNDID